MGVDRADADSADADSERAPIAASVFASHGRAGFGGQLKKGMTNGDPGLVFGPGICSGKLSDHHRREERIPLPVVLFMELQNRKKF